MSENEIKAGDTAKLLRKTTDERDEARAAIAALEAELDELRKKLDAEEDAGNELIESANRRCDRAIKRAEQAEAETARLKKLDERHTEWARQELDHERAKNARLEFDIERFRVGEECHLDRSGTGVYECGVNAPCPACRLRLAEDKIAQLKAVIKTAAEKLVRKNMFVGTHTTIGKAALENAADAYDTLRSALARTQAPPRCYDRADRTRGGRVLPRRRDGGGDE